MDETICSVFGYMHNGYIVYYFNCIHLSIMTTQIYSSIPIGHQPVSGMYPSLYMYGNSNHNTLMVQLYI